jgi:hypothetical protein
MECHKKRHSLAARIERAIAVEQALFIRTPNDASESEIV